MYFHNKTISWYVISTLEVAGPTLESQNVIFIFMLF